jgi:hypothetical protein
LPEPLPLPAAEALTSAIFDTKWGICCEPLDARARPGHRGSLDADRRGSGTFAEALPGGTPACRFRRTSWLGALDGRPRPCGSSQERGAGARRGGPPEGAAAARAEGAFRAELAAAERGAADLDLQAVIDASRYAALAEDGLVFHGYGAGGIDGIGPSSPHEPVSISDDYSHYPEHVAKAVASLRAADIAGPYAIALGGRCFTGVTETTEHGGYPVFEHLRQILGGPVVWAPAVDGAVVLSRRGGDYELTVGEDFSIGYATSDASTVELYIEESIAFRINTPEAAVALTYG